jgi:hypothetical protein
MTEKLRTALAAQPREGFTKPTPQEDLMPYRFWLKLAAIVIAVALSAAMIQSWRADQRNRAQLAAELAATKQLLAAAGARQHDRDAQLAQTLSALAAEKRTVATPAQIIRNLPNQIPLPAPITLQADHNASSLGATLGSPAIRPWAGQAPPLQAEKNRLSTVPSSRRRT